MIPNDGIDLDRPNTAAAINAGEGQQQIVPNVNVQPQKQPDAPPQKGPVPYERFESLAHANQELKKQLEDLSSRQAALEQPIRVQQDLAAKKAREQEFWKNPHEYVEKSKEELRAEYQRLQYEAQDNAKADMMISQFRSSPGYTKELESAVSSYLAQNSLGRLGNSKAIEVAYQAVTGREFGNWQTNNYTTRELKERLTRPTGNGQAAPEVMDDMAFRELSIEEYEKDPQKYNKAMEAYAKSLG